MSLTPELGKRGRFAKVSLIWLKNIYNNAIFCLHCDRIDAFDKMSNFHRQFVIYFKEKWLWCQGKRGTLELVLLDMGPTGLRLLEPTARREPKIFATKALRHKIYN